MDNEDAMAAEAVQEEEAVVGLEEEESPTSAGEAEEESPAEEEAAPEEETSPHGEEEEAPEQETPDATSPLAEDDAETEASADAEAEAQAEAEAEAKANAEAEAKANAEAEAKANAEAEAKANAEAEAKAKAEAEAKAKAEAEARAAAAAAEAQKAEQKKREEEERRRQQQEKEEAAKQQQQPQEKEEVAQGGGWGWGGWLSSVVDKSARLVSDLALTVEEEHRPAGGGQGLKLYRTDAEVEAAQARAAEAAEQAKETVLEERLLSGTVEAFSGASSYLGGVLTDLKETAAKVAAEIDVATISDQASSMAAHTIDALETVSSKTMTMLQPTEAPGVQQLGEIALLAQPGGDGSGGSDGRGEIAEKAAAGPPTFQQLFDQELGNVHLQALELLSTECTMKVQEAQRRCGMAKMQLLVAHLQLLRDKFEDEDEPDPSDPLPEMAISSKAQSVLEKLGEIRAAAEATAKELGAAAEAAVKAAAEEEATEEAATEDAPSKGDRTTAAAEQQLLLLHQSALKMLAKVSSASVELVNRVGESWLVNSKEAPADSEQGEGLPQPSLSVRQAAYVQLLSAKLADDMSNSAFFFVCAVRKISAACTGLLKDGEAPAAEALTATCNEKINNIYLDTGDAISNVHDGKDFLIPLVQWVYLLSEAGITG